MSRALPVAGLVFALGAGAVALGFEASPGPGSPATLPLLSTCVMALALAALLAGSGTPSAPAEAGARTAARSSVPLALATGLYVAALPWLGFHLATGAFLVATVRHLGGSWNLAGLVAVNTVSVVQLLFALVFGVVLPEGLFA